MSLILFTALLLCIIMLFVFLNIVSPGRPSPLRGEEGNPAGSGICEKTYADIGGVKQGMFIRGKDTVNPVLLFVHGGPSFSEFFLVEKYPTGLENHFTVCYWEERGGGLSFTPDVTRESLTLEQLASDAVEVTNYLRKRFNQDRIYIMAHSGGTAFAIKAAAENPQLYNAYIGMAQITRQSESEKRACIYMSELSENLGDKKLLSALKEYPVTEDDSSLLPFFNSGLRDKAMHKLGIGTMRNMKSVITGVFIPVWTCRAYTVKEKFNIWRSKLSFVNRSGLRAQILNTDFTSEFTSLDIPVYFFSGRYDYTVNHDLSREYLNNLLAPAKGFYTFENSAHSPMFEEPGRFLEIMTTDVLKGTTLMSDPRPDQIR
jgi:pimeloyl-ACP methyl ester carboxylesterase